VYPRDFRQELRQGKVRPAYVLWGGDQEQVREAVASLREKVVSPGMESFNVLELDAQEVPAGDAIAAARTRAMGGGGRLVVVRNPSAWRKKDRDDLVAHLGEPEEGNCLVVAVDDESRQNALVQAAAGRGILVDFSPPPQGRKRSVITEGLERLGIAADREALELLERSLPEDTGLIHRELEKVALYLGDHRRVAARDLEGLLSGYGVAGVNDLLGAVANRQAAAALRAADGLLEQGMEPVALQGLLAYQVRLLLHVKLLERGLPMTDEVKKKTRFLPELKRQASRWDADDLADALRDLQQRVDRRLKSVKVSPALLIEAWLARHLA
jgi:DNA polymerase-3 subunit delta